MFHTSFLLTVSNGEGVGDFATYTHKVFVQLSAWSLKAVYEQDVSRVFEDTCAFVDDTPRFHLPPYWSFSGHVSFAR